MSTIQLRDTLRYVIIEGVIGAGKTTLARLLAQRFQGQLVLEEFEDNAFLPKFYEDPVRWGFQTQLAFLASRFKQQKKLSARDLFHELTVADYSFDKDRIFAHLNLQGDELQLYETLFTLMEPATPTPDLVVLIQSSTDRLMENIAKRGRSYERQISRSYLDDLNEAYTYHFRRYTKSPLLIIKATHIDFVNDQAVLDALVRQIVTVPHADTTVFDPASTDAASTDAVS